jgi:hypothetical protein
MKRVESITDVLPETIYEIFFGAATKSMFIDTANNWARLLIYFPKAETQGYDRGWIDVEVSRMGFGVITAHRVIDKSPVPIKVFKRHFDDSWLIDPTSLRFRLANPDWRKQTMTKCLEEILEKEKELEQLHALAGMVQNSRVY